MDIDSINEHSPWWARGFAIILGVIVLLSVANLFYLEVFGINGINHYSFGNEPDNPGEYPINGTDDEQRQYNYSIQEWDDYQSYLAMMNDLEDSNVTEVTQIFAGLAVIIGVPAIAMFWTHNKSHWRCLDILHFIRHCSRLHEQCTWRRGLFLDCKNFRIYFINVWYFFHCTNDSFGKYVPFEKPNP